MFNTRTDREGSRLKGTIQDGTQQAALSTFKQQVAGHKGENQMLLDESGRSIYKPLNVQEGRFYGFLDDLARQQPNDFPAHFFPRYLGTTVHNGRGWLWILLWMTCRS